MNFIDINSNPVAVGDNIVFADEHVSNRVDSDISLIGMSRGTITEIHVNDSEMCTYNITIDKIVNKDKTTSVTVETIGRYLDWIVKI